MAFSQDGTEHLRQEERPRRRFRLLQQSHRLGESILQANCPALARRLSTTVDTLELTTVRIASECYTIGSIEVYTKFHDPAMHQPGDSMRQQCPGHDVPSMPDELRQWLPAVQKGSPPNDPD